MNTRTLVVLQNVWYRHPRKAQALLDKYGYDFYVRTLAASRSGRRLAEIFPPPWNPYLLRFINTTPRLGSRPSSRLSGCADYVRNHIRDFGPRVIVACGDQAKTTVFASGWQNAQSLLLLPHPAYRLLTNQLLREARDLACWLTQLAGVKHIRLRQRPDGVEITELVECPTDPLGHSDIVTFKPRDDVPHYEVEALLR